MPAAQRTAPEPRTPPGKPVAPPYPPECKGASEARLRPIAKAIMHPGGFVRMGGGYGGRGEAGVAKAQDFDTRRMVEWCVVGGLLAGGPWANTYAPTQRGLAARAAWDAYQDARAAHVEAMRAWRAAQAQAAKEAGRRR